MKQHPRFAIGIPTINRWDLLKDSLKKYERDFKGVEIFILDNGLQNIVQEPRYALHYINEVPKNLGVAASWNWLCNSIFKRGYDHALILNDDIYLGANEDVVNLILNEHKNVDFVLSEKDFCVFVMPKKTFSLVGGFDSSFYPAYFEDNDYLYRLKLKEAVILRTPSLNPSIHRNSMTYQKDNSLANGFMPNREYYIYKWGGLPGHETYTVPFNKTDDTKE